MTTAPSPYSQLWRWEVTQAIKDLIAGGGSGGGGIPEAPATGKVYGRSNTTWVDAWANPVLTGSAQAPTMSAADSSTAIATTAYVNSKLAGYAPTASPVFTGNPTGPTPAPGDNDTSLATTAFVTAAVAASNVGGPWAPLASPAFTGNPTGPTAAPGDNDTSLATTAFVSAAITASNVGGPWAPIASPTFSGDPKAPTPTAGDNDTSIATTAFVTAAVAASNVGGPWAPLASPTFSGDPKAPTPATADNDTSIATTAYVKAQGYITDAASDGLLYGRKNGAWTAIVSGGVIISDTAPPATSGQLWWESDTGNFYVYFADQDSSQWIMIASATAGGGSQPASGRVPGEVATFAMNTPPQGWLKCNGAIVSRTLYPALFLAIGTTYGAGDGSTTFALPDLRGEFLRGFDDGRGVDASRTIGSAQAGDIQSHAHTQQGSFTTGYVSVDHSHYVNPAANTGGRSYDHAHTVGIARDGDIDGWAGWGTVKSGGYMNEVMVGRGGTGTGGENGDHVHYWSWGGNTGGISANHTHAVTISGATTNAGGAETRPRNVAMLYCIKY